MLSPLISPHLLDLFADFFNLKVAENPTCLQLYSFFFLLDKLDSCLTELSGNNLIARISDNPKTELDLLYLWSTCLLL